MADSPALLDAYTAEFAPSGPAEATLVRRLAVLTARLDLLARAFDTLPALHEAEAGEKHLAAQDALYDPFAAMPARSWAEARAAADPDGATSASPSHEEICGNKATAPTPADPATAPTPDPATDPDLATRTLIYALTSPRAALLLRHDTAADRRYIATLRELQRLQAARRRAGPAFPPSTAHLEAISDLLDRGYQFLPPDHPLAPSQNEPNPHLAPAICENEPNPAPRPAPTYPPSSPLQNAPNPAPALPQTAAAEAHPCHPQSAPVLAMRPQSQASPAMQYEPNPTPAQPQSSPGPTRPQSAPVLAMRPQSQVSPESQNEPNPAPMPASDLAILDRLTRHAEQTILAAARHPAARTSCIIYPGDQHACHIHVLRRPRGSHPA